MKNLSIILLSIFCFLSCEEQMVMIPEFMPPDSKRVILLEDLTGVNCPNCPAGSAEFESMLKLFPGNLVGYGVHGLFLTDPRPTSAYDFRNPDGIELENYLSPFRGKPAAVINRVQFEDEDFLSVSTIDLWQSYVTQELNRFHFMDLEIETEYNDAERQLEIIVDIKPTTLIEGELHLNVTVAESHIIDAQETDGPLIQDYEHNHVLREILTDVRGNIIGTNLTEADSTRINLSYSLPAEDGTWIAENMEVIAFVTNHFTDADGNKTEEVVQAAVEHFVE